jgi:hypothetical protein
MTRAESRRKSLSAPSRSKTGSEECDEATRSTLCDLDVENNVWVEGVVDLAAGKRGICTLDYLNRPQIVDILKHDPRAREDLPRVTSNPELRQLVRDTQLYPGKELSEDLQSRSAKNPASFPFYSVFRGRPPTARR